MDATINLFKALIVKEHKTRKPSKDFYMKTLKYGVVFSEDVIREYSEPMLISIAKELGSTSSQLNNSFHKSWSKVKNASDEQLILEQVIHYFTTYGLESVGLYNESTVFIPAERLDAIKTETSFILVKGYTMKELYVKIVDFLEAGIALKEETINDVVTICGLVGFKEIGAVKNKEVKLILGYRLGIVPEDPTEFLRLLVFVSTGKSLLIKDKATIKTIVEKKNPVRKILGEYDSKYGYEKLASIFYRFKPIFLAFRKNDKATAKIINNLRRLARTHHVPLKADYLNSVTANLDKVKPNELATELFKVNIFRKIRLLYALKFRTTNPESIMYRVRNGKSYSTEYSAHNPDKCNRLMSIVYASILGDLDVKGKKVFIPESVEYALPSSEKQFTGAFPSGTSITSDKDMIMGVHWEDVDNHRIDLDLSLITAEAKIGWDASYRNDARSVLFSGDLTSAPKPKGASELFFVKRQKKESYLVSLNYYNHSESKELVVPFKIIVAKETPVDFKSNYTINPNNILGYAVTSIKDKKKILGLLTSTQTECKFVFAEMINDDGISASSEKSKHSRAYLVNFYKNMISLNKLLVDAGAKLVDSKDEADLDLSPESLEKDTIIKLLTK